jgi:hypothetical protein
VSTRVLPFLRTAILCQDIEFDGNSYPFKLVEPLHTLILAPEKFGEPLTEMFLYSQLEDANGKFEFSMRVEDESGNLIPQPSLRSVDRRFVGSADERVVPVELPLRLAGLVFAEPGVYYFQLRCDTISLHQRDGAARAPFLRVLSG